MQIFYSGLPGTLKFLSEFYIFSGLLNTCPLIVIILLFIANFLGLIGFSKCWFNVTFGLTLKFQDKLPVDLTSKDLLIIFICLGFLILFGFGFNILF